MREKKDYGMEKLKKMQNKAFLGKLDKKWA